MGGPPGDGWMPYAYRYRVSRDAAAGTGSATILVVVPLGSVLEIDHLVLGVDNVVVAATLDVDVEAPNGVVLGPLLDATAMDNQTLPLGPVFPTALGGNTIKGLGGTLRLHSDMQLRVLATLLEEQMTVDLYVVGWRYGAPPTVTFPTALTTGALASFGSL